MQVVGKTSDGKLVVRGIGKMYFETGLPLSIIFDRLKDNNLQPSFLHLYDELMGNGMKHDRIVHLFSEHVFETYGKDYRDEVIARIKQN